MRWLQSRRSRLFLLGAVLITAGFLFAGPLVRFAVGQWLGSQISGSGSRYRVRIGAIQTDLFTRVSLHSVVVRSARSPELMTFKVDSVRVRYAFRGFGKEGGFHLLAVEIDRPTLFLPLEGGIAPSTEENGSSSAPSLPESFILTGGRVASRSGALSPDWELDGIEIAASHSDPESPLKWKGGILSIRIKGMDSGKGVFTGEASGERLIVSNAAFDLFGGRIGVSPSEYRVSDGSITAHLVLDKIDLRSLRSAFSGAPETTYAGTLRGKLDFQGIPKEPSSWNIHVDGNLTGQRIGHRPLKDVTLNLAFEGGGGTALLRQGPTYVSFRPERIGEVWKVVGEGDLVRLEDLAGPWLPGLSGRLQFNGSFDDLPEGSRAQVDLSWRDLRWNRFVPGSGQVKIHFKDRNWSMTDLRTEKGDLRFEGALETGGNLQQGKLQFSSRALSSGQELGTLAVSWGTGAQGVRSVTLHSRIQDCENLSPFLDIPYRYGGKVSIDLQGPMRGDPGVSSLRDFQGTFLVENGWLVPLLDKGTGVRKIQARIKGTEGQWTVDEFSGVLKDLPVRITGNLDVRKSPSRFTGQLGVLGTRILGLEGRFSPDLMEVSFSARGLDLTMAAPLWVEGRDLAGTLSADLDLHRDKRGLRWKGFLETRNLGWTQTDLGLRIRSGDFRVSFSESGFIFEKGDARINEGALRIGGGVKLKGRKLVSSDLALSLDKIRTETDAFKAEILHSRLQWTVLKDRMAVSGEITLGPSRWTQDFRWSDMLSTRRPPPRAPLEGFLEEILGTPLDVQIRADDNLWLDNNMARVRMGAELGLQGTLLHPGLVGRIVAVDGRFGYLDRWFDVTEGEVRFEDPRSFSPKVRLVSQTQVKAEGDGMDPYRIRLEAQGPPEALEFRLSSEPPLPESDILALLTVGTTRAQMTGENEGGGRMIAERARSMAMDYSTQRIGQTIGLESLTIEGDPLKPNSGTGARVTASKQINPNVMITYRTAVGRMNEQDLRIGYRLSSKWRIESQTNQTGQSGLDLKYRLLSR